MVEAIASLKQVASDMNKMIGEATNVTTQISNTAQSYKQALLQVAPQGPQVQHPYHMHERNMQPDPRILVDIDRKVRQILVDMIDPDMLNTSLVEIKEKVRTSIASVTNLSPLQNTEVIDINKLRKGSITILFKGKHVIEWLKDHDVELGFLSAFMQDATISKQTYPILIPHVPLSFDPSCDMHLGEIEEINNLLVGAIQMARWIKPIYRRALGQRAAHAIFTLEETTVANHCISDGVYICGLCI